MIFLATSRSGLFADRLASQSSPVLQFVTRKTEENVKGGGVLIKSKRGRKSMGGRKGERRLEGQWGSWITMAGVQSWLIVSDTLQF